MNLLDVVIIVVVLGALVWGSATGVVVQVGGFLGLLLGLYLGALLAPEVVNWASSPYWRAVLVISAVAVPAATLSVLAVLGARRFVVLVDRWHLEIPDRILGGLVAGTGALFLVWIVAGSAAVAETAGLGPLVQDSAIIRALDERLPPSPEVAARLERLIDPLGVPRIFAGLEPPTAQLVAPPADPEVRAAAAATAASTVRVRSRGCGGELLGSGFVAAPGLVVTNAHVIAGVDSTVVEDAHGSHPAVPVRFDPGLDIAVLRTRDLAGPPLALASGEAPRGSPGAVMGYPGGGDLSTGPAAVLATYSALGRDIYGESLVSRNVYALAATVRPGNSGGPFALPDGSVAGVVFGSSVSDPGVGYALVASEVRPDLEAAVSSGPVGTGACLAG
jgi:S1-C subfamily serine protease